MSQYINIPVKEIIVNSDTQVRLLEDDGTVYADNDVVAGTSGGFILEGWLSLVMAANLNLLDTAVRIRTEAPSAGVAEVTSYVLTDLTCPEDAQFRLVVESLDLTPVGFQNHPKEVRFQIPAQTTVDGAGAAIAAAINGNKFAPVTAVYTSGSDTLDLTAKAVGQKVRLYSSDYTLPAVSVTTPPALPLNTYDYLKNINWAKNFDIDRDVNWMPLPGVSYTSYYFEVKSTSPTPGNDPQPNETHNQSITGFKLWVAAGLTLKTKMDLLVGDANA